MFNKLLLASLLLFTTHLFSYEVTFGDDAKKVDEKTEVEHTFKRDDAKEIVLDAKSFLMWQDDVSVKNEKKSLVDANNYCHRLTLAGFTSWYLQSIKELKTITDIKLKTSAINIAFKNVKSDFYISSSPKLSDRDTIEYMDFKHGHDYKGSRRGKAYVRCVRTTKK